MLEMKLASTSQNYFEISLSIKKMNKAKQISTNSILTTPSPPPSSPQYFLFRGVKLKS